MMSLGAVIIVHNGGFRFSLRHARRTFPIRNSVRFRERLFALNFERLPLIALRHLAQAQGIAKVAKAAGIERESLYRALSSHGNPRLSTLVAVTKAIGLRLTVEAAQ